MFSATLLEWFSRNGRDLPWRHRHDAYAIWLSEIILQQTRIAQGTDYWHRFMERFPTVEELARASEDEVLRLWQGLGYYSRARNLHAAAQQVVQMGGFPTTAKELLQLKGVGPYTAAAIASFSFGEPVAAVDGNAFRVLARIFGISTPIDSNQGKKEFTALAQSLLPANAPADFNQAMMDFGATQCVPNGVPDCDACPFMLTCVARRENRIDALPAKEKKTKVTERQLIYVYVRYNGKTAVRKRGASDIWQGLWEPLQTDNASAYAQQGRLTLLAKQVKHVLTHRILLADFYLLETDKPIALPPDYQWIDESKLDSLAKPRLIERLLALL